MKKIEKHLDKDLLSCLRLSGPIGLALLATSSYATEKKGLYRDYFTEHLPEYIDPDGGIVTKHGWLTYEYNSSGKYLGFKDYVLDGGFREPLIVHWPDNIRSGLINNNEICTSDITAICTDVLRIKPKDNEAENSYSFLPNLLDNNISQIHTSFTLTYGGCSTFIVIKNGFKYIESTLKPALFLKEETVNPQGPTSCDNGLYNIHIDKSEPNIYIQNGKSGRMQAAG